MAICMEDDVNELFLLTQLVEGRHGGACSGKVLIDERERGSDGVFSLVCRRDKNQENDKEYITKQR